MMFQNNDGSAGAAPTDAAGSGKNPFGTNRTARRAMAAQRRREARQVATLKRKINALRDSLPLASLDLTFDVKG